LAYVDELPPHASFEVPSGGSLRLSLASFHPSADASIEVSVGANGLFVGAFADLSPAPLRFSITVRLVGEGARCEWHLAALAGGQNAKSFAASVSHEAPLTEALMSNYGIARGEGTLSFAGFSEIRPGSHKSKTRQVAKIIVFDRTADGLASPILKIGDNDVEASHAAVVGRLSEDHLFYLESRGVSAEEAKRLIALGYLKPIEGYFADEALARRIDEAIEGGI
jgi:Fe-S cluster assembly protein SufD